MSRKQLIVSRWQDNKKIKKIKNFVKDGRVCEPGLTQAQLFDLRDSLMRSAQAEDDIAIVVEPIGKLQQKQAQNFEKALQRQLNQMTARIKWRAPNSMFLFTLD